MIMIHNFFHIYRAICKKISQCIIIRLFFVLSERTIGKKTQVYSIFRSVGVRG